MLKRVIVTLPEWLAEEIKKQAREKDYIRTEFERVLIKRALTVENLKAISPTRKATYNAVRCSLSLPASIVEQIDTERGAVDRSNWVSELFRKGLGTVVVKPVSNKQPGRKCFMTSEFMRDKNIPNLKLAVGFLEDFEKEGLVRRLDKDCPADKVRWQICRPEDDRS